jgi:hypothetical protein
MYCLQSSFREMHAAPSGGGYEKAQWTEHPDRKTCAAHTGKEEDFHEQKSHESEGKGREVF